MESEQLILSPYKMGDLELPNRMVMAAMTRNRCNPNDSVPHDLHVEYYSARATAGLMFTECAAMSKEGNGLPGNGALYTDA